jgi:hypothetical protein
MMAWATRESPPTISTLPFGNKVAVCFQRAVPIVDTAPGDPSLSSMKIREISQATIASGTIEANPMSAEYVLVTAICF